MRLLTAVSGVRVPQQAPQSTRKRVLFARASPPTCGTAVDAIAPARANNRYSVALLLTGVESRGRRQKAPENGCFCFVSGTHPCACNGTRAGKPADTRNRSGRDCAVGRTIAIPSRCSLRGSSPVAGATEHPKTARGQARRHAEPQWTRLRPRGRTIAIPSRCSLRGFEQSCQRQRQNNEPKGKRLRHFTFKVISGACACAGGGGAGEGGGGTGHAPY